MARKSIEADISQMIAIRMREKGIKTNRQMAEKAGVSYNTLCKCMRNDQQWDGEFVRQLSRGGLFLTAEHWLIYGEGRKQR